MKNAAKYLVAGSCLVCAIWSLSKHSKTQQCRTLQGRAIDVSASGTCHDAKARLLYTVSERVHRVTSSHRLRNTQCGARIQMHWDGSIHQLVDPGRAPAVTTGKQHIRVCLDDDPGIDAVVFVALHELAHIGSGTVGHTAEFWFTFKLLLQIAEREGVYTHHDPTRTVCGEPIGDVPRLS